MTWWQYKMNWSGEKILRRYGLTLNIKRGTIEHNEQPWHGFTTFSWDFFHAYSSSLIILWILALTKGSLFSCFCVIELALGVLLISLPQYLSFNIPDDFWFLHRTIYRTVVIQAKSRCTVISALFDRNPTYEDTIIFFFASQSWLKK